MRLIRVLTRFSRKNMDTLNTGNHVEAVAQYKKNKDEVRIKSSVRMRRENLGVVILQLALLR